MPTLQPGTRLYISYNSVDVTEWTYTSTIEGLLRVVPVESDRMGIAMGQRFVAEPEFEKVWSLYPQEAVAKRTRANVLHFEEEIEQLTSKIKDLERAIEYKKQMISDLFAANEDIVDKFPEMFL